MKIRTILLLLIVFATFIACESASDKLEKRRAEVMKVHDDAMARIGEINNAVKNLNELRTTSADSIKIDAAIKDLENAEEGMMLWMQNYKEPSDGLEKFYSDELKKITVVSNDINNSLENVKEYIKD